MRSAVRPDAVSAAPQSSAGWGPYAGEQHFTTPATTVSWSRRGISMPFDASGAEDPWMNAEALDPFFKLLSKTMEFTSFQQRPLISVSNRASIKRLITCKQQ